MINAARFSATGKCAAKARRLTPPHHTVRLIQFTGTLLGSRTIQLARSVEHVARCSGCSTFVVTLAERDTSIPLYKWQGRSLVMSSPRGPESMLQVTCRNGSCSRRPPVSSRMWNNFLANVQFSNIINVAVLCCLTIAAAAAAAAAAAMHCYPTVQAKHSI
jgi:hypothetical protein